MISENFTSPFDLSDVLYICINRCLFYFRWLLPSPIIVELDVTCLIFSLSGDVKQKNHSLIHNKYYLRKHTGNSILKYSKKNEEMHWKVDSKSK